MPPDTPKIGPGAMFVMVVMGYGTLCHIQTSDWETCSINDDFIAPFDEINWDVMKGKPKIFLFQTYTEATSKFPHFCVILFNPVLILFFSFYTWFVCSICVLRFLFR